MINGTIVRRLGLLLALLTLISLFIPTFIAAQDDTPPPIPHKLEKRGNCLSCHKEGKLKSPKIPEDHTDRANDVCQDCHQPVGAAGAPQANTPPPIPHTLEKRDDCLSCHKQGKLKSPKIPDNHADRANEVCRDCHRPAGEAGPIAGAPQVPHTLVNHENCLSCHLSAEPTPTPGPPPLPTPIVHPQAEGVDNCVECHTKLDEKNQTDIVAQSERSIHTEREVSCADCHGGDPSASTAEEAKSAAAGYVGVPAKADIPALCASCHAKVTMMRQYDLPTDQYAKYQESNHGLQLNKGDDNVATCFDCHGGHQILKANDPASTVYPANVPTMCANCHADKKLMAPYNIPTNQFDLYKGSVHGHALYDKHDLRSPTCATCHGTHGAAPPGFEEVANVCGSCHSATQDYYLESSHVTGDDTGPKCVTCHGRYDVSQPTEALYLGAEPRHCGECHASDSEEGQVAQSLYDSISTAATAYDDAELAIQNARSVGMLVSPLEGRLSQANTDLVTARAAQHTLDLKTVADRADKARAGAEQVKADAEAAIAANAFRRRAMVIAVAAIGLTIVALYMLKKELDRRLEADSES